MAPPQAISRKSRQNDASPANTSTKDSEHEFDYTTLILYVNGERVEEKDVDPRTTLAVFLRDHRRLTGTKIGCNEGGCGACTVMISDIDPLNGEIRHYSANACLTPVCAVFGKAVTTVEGIGSTTMLHPVQERLSRAHGSQCGFCTPGFVMAMYTLLRNNPKPTKAEIDEAIQGNLCRCTGYRPILEAFYSFSQNDNLKEQCAEGNTPCSMGEQCCKNTRGKCNNERNELKNLSSFDGCKSYDPNQQLIFPPELKVGGFSQKSFVMHHKDYHWYQPTSLAHALSLKTSLPNARIIAGNSEVGVELKFRFINLKHAINLRQIAELRSSHLDESQGAYLGMGLSLSEVQTILRSYINELPEHKTRVFSVIVEMLHWFAGKHIRNMATIAGNIATASPISDLNPIWMAANASVVALSAKRGARRVPLDQKFFVAYRKTVIEDDEILTGIWIPYSNERQYFRAFKQAQRREDDITIVTTAIMLELQEHSDVVKWIRIAYGGMAPTTKMAFGTQAALRLKEWNEELLERAIEELRDEFTLAPDVPGGMARYRHALAIAFFFKFFTYVAHRIEQGNIRRDRRNVCSLDHKGQKLIASQIYQDVPDSQPNIDPVGRPLMHQSGVKHATGEAKYCDDYNCPDALNMVMVLSPIACGTLNSVDWSEAMKEPGVRAYIDHHDVRDGVMLGHTHDTPIFVKDKISYHCQPIGAIIADSHEAARRGANLVKISCTEEKATVTIEDAIANNSYLMDSPFVVRSCLADDYGDHDAVTDDWSQYDHVIEGSIKIGGQEHFYLETQNCIVIPGEVDEFEIITSTQCVRDVQVSVAYVLNIPQHKINVKVKRIGGGFGGKENTSSLFVVPTAIAAKKLRRAIKFTVERFDDMAISGTRHPFRCDYKVGVSNGGKLLNVRALLLSNCGHSFDLSVGVIHRAIVHFDNVYRFPNAEISGRMCKTNLASNTAFRGFGAPQAMFASESMMAHIADEIGINVNELREKNLYKEGECTPFGMHLQQCNIRRCWTECFELSDYEIRLNAVNDFNRNSKYIKRGIYITPTKFGVAFGLKHLNQAGALVHIYTDGSVLVSHGGIEMGQGLHTKMLQVTARCLGIDISKVYLCDTATDKVPNASPTAASASSDLYGLAIMDACDKLNERLKPIRIAHPDFNWEQLVSKAYLERICLSSTGFSTIHSEAVDFLKGKGAEMFGYCVYGTSCSEVEVDCLTGDHRLLRCDIVMDIGDSLNPAVDIGQIEGAFIQGYGLFTMEELKIRPNGIRLTRGPGTYKIPSADDIPRQFHVKLLKGSSNKMAIFSSKAVGEPPLFLGASAFFAIKEAIRAYRTDNGHNGYFRFDSPATPERIRMACEDPFTDKVPQLPEASSYTPWTAEL
uniref:xanthine dehydrogenase n=1 Tax=Ascaris suum TaxID=6253 RepID=F1KRL5_ASCSU